MRALVTILALLALAFPAYAQCGGASWYGRTGNRTASGDHYTGAGMTAAHRTLPFGTRVRVTDKASGHAVTVRINDRGPFIAGRIIDLSAEAATKFRLKGPGVRNVCIEVLP